MKERPFKLYEHEVQAILAGNQTQIRRVVKLPDNGFHNFQFSHMYLHNAVFVSNGDGVTRAENIACPYGQIGDQLWGRETWSADYPEVSYKAGGNSINLVDSKHSLELLRLYDTQRGEWRPSIHMPHWASRIQLEITNIRVERLQDISEADAWKEGVDTEEVLQIPASCGASAVFSRLWESINGHGSWDLNPWVWVIEFKRVERAA